MPPTRVRTAAGFNPRNNLALSTDGTRIFDGGLDGTSDIVEYTWPGLSFVANHSIAGGAAVVIAVRGSTLWWIQRPSDYELHEEGGGLVATITDEGQGGMSLTYNAVDDNFYSFNPVPSGGNELLQITPGGTVTTVLALTTTEASVSVLPPSVTPDGAVWGLSWEASVNRTVWYRYDPISDTGEYHTFPVGPWPHDEDFVLVPRPDNSVWFVSQADSLGYRLEPDGTITAEPTLDLFMDEEFNEFEFSLILSLAQTPDCNTIVFVSENAWWSLIVTTEGLRVGFLRMRPT